jgi:nitroreductase
MSHDAASLFLRRRSVRHFDPAHRLEEREILELLELAGRAPSSWNLQHWKFLVFSEPEAKAKLLPIARGQRQVVEASATIAVLGDLEANLNARKVYGPAVKAGLRDAYAGYDSYAAMMAQIEEAYAVNLAAPYRRDEAIRNASLAAMQLMLAATAKGLDSGPMVGFDAEAFVRAFRVPPRYIPVLLVAVGKAAKPARPTTRLPVEETVVWNGF